MTIVVLTKKSQDELATCPSYIVRKFMYWVGLIEMYGLRATQQIKGFHDEPLKGKRAGQRSVRLNHAYRVIYVIDRDGASEMVEVCEVTKHAY